MPLRVSSVTIAALDPEAVAAFWCRVLGYEVVDREGDDVVSIAGEHGPAIDVVRVGEAKTAQNRLHLDLRADGAGRAQELARLEGLGVRRVDVGQGADVSWTVFADPEGNEFCLLSRTADEAAVP